MKTGLGDWLATRRGTLVSKISFLCWKVNLCEVAGNTSSGVFRQPVQILALPFPR